MEIPTWEIFPTFCVKKNNLPNNSIHLQNDLVFILTQEDRSWNYNTDNVSAEVQAVLQKEQDASSSIFHSSMQKASGKPESIWLIYVFIFEKWSKSLIYWEEYNERR